MNLKKNLIKTICYRAISAASTIGIAWAMFGNFEIAGAFGVVDMIANSAIYFGYELVWGKVVRS